MPARGNAARTGGAGSRVLDRLAAPELLLDLFDLVLAQPEVVAELVDDRLRDAVANLVVIAARFFGGLLVDRNAVRQIVAERPRPLGQRRAVVETEQRVAVVDLHLREQFRRRFVFDDYRDVAHFLAKAPRNFLQRVFDESFKPLSRHFLTLAGRRTAAPLPVPCGVRRAAAAGRAPGGRPRAMTFL